LAKQGNIKLIKRQEHIMSMAGKVKSFRVHPPIHDLSKLNSVRIRERLEEGMGLPLKKIRELVKEDRMFQGGETRVTSFRIEKETERKIRGIARRLGVKESDVIRALVWRKKLEEERTRLELKLASEHGNQKKLDEY